MTDRRRLTLVDVPVSSLMPEALSDPSVANQPVRSRLRHGRVPASTVRMLTEAEQSDRSTYFRVDADVKFLTDKALMYELKNGVHNFVGAERFASRIETHLPEPIDDIEDRYLDPETKDRPLETASKQLIPVLREVAERLEVEEPLMGGAELTEFAELAQHAMNPQLAAFERPHPSSDLFL